MHHILVTGGAGFIGANFVNYWLKNYSEDKIIVLDALTYAGCLKNLASVQHFSNYEFIHGNILDENLLKTIFNHYQIDTVVHFAAESHVDRSIQHPENFIQTNILGTAALLTAAREAWSSFKDRRFHHISTDEVYGALGPDDSAFTEKSPYCPNSPYAASKASSDHLVRAFHYTYGLPITLSNCSNNYGPYQHREKLIPTIIQNCLDWRPIPIYGDGSHIRDWIYVEDHCKAIDLILCHGLPGETYNIGGNNQISNLTLAEKICYMMDELFPQKPSHYSLLSFVKDRPGHDWRYAVDTSKINSQLGFNPTTRFLAGLKQTIQYYLAQHDQICAL